MTKLPWTDDYGIGIEELDEQHKCLVAHVNELHDAIEQQKPRNLVSDVVHMLIEYVKIHFAVEETLIRFFHYDAYLEHKMRHDTFMQRLRDYQEEYLAGDDKVATEMLLYLEDWLPAHIISSGSHFAQDRNEMSYRSRPL